MPRSQDQREKRVGKCATAILQLVEDRGVVETKADLVEGTGFALAVVERALKRLRGIPGGVVYQRTKPRGYVKVPGGRASQPREQAGSGGKASRRVKALKSTDGALWQETTSGTLPEESFKVVEKKEDELEVLALLDKIKKEFEDTCPRCSSPTRKTFIVVGGNRRILVNQCRVCKFYLPV
ncbi:MAG: hypothetical protein Kow0069_04080 [Promethearchaeota archaeon]